MGGIGAHSDEDYNCLRRFVNVPWEFPEAIEARCSLDADCCADGPSGPGMDWRRPVRLVVFGFDETLTLATFLPTGSIKAQFDWKLDPSDQEHLVKLNFETPFVKEGKRVCKLRNLFEQLTAPPAGCAPCRLAVLMQGEERVGAVAALNLLRLAGLDGFFEALWTIWRSPTDQVNNGLFRVGSEWRAFNPPSVEEMVYKGDAIHDLVARPSAWLPQLDLEKGAVAELKDLKVEDVLLVDDEHSAFRRKVGALGGVGVLRFCKVAKYDEENFWDRGQHTELGGLGAKSDEDYARLLRFAHESHATGLPRVARSPTKREVPPSPILRLKRRSGHAGHAGFSP